MIFPLFRLTIFFVITALSFGCVSPDCNRVDEGTCVNACCKLKFKINGDAAGSAKLLADTMAASIAKGGPDGRYFPVENNAVQPWSSKDDVVLQAIHTTEKYTYNDTLHFAISPPEGGGHDAVTLHAFSHSQDFIQGNFAYSDHGQNFKNLILMVKSLNLQYTFSTVFGCPYKHERVKPMLPEEEGVPTGEPVGEPAPKTCGCPKGMICPSPAPPNRECNWLGAKGYVCGTTAMSACQPKNATAPYTAPPIAQASTACCTKCSTDCTTRDCNETELELTGACNCGGVFVAHNHSWSSPCREMCRMNSFCRTCNPAC